MFGNIIAGLLGASLGGKLFGSFGPSFGGIHVVPALLGAIVLIFYCIICSESCKEIDIYRL